MANEERRGEEPLSEEEARESAKKKGGRKFFETFWADKESGAENVHATSSQARRGGKRRKNNVDA